MTRFNMNLYTFTHSRTPRGLGSWMFRVSTDKQQEILKLALDAAIHKHQLDPVGPRAAFFVDTLGDESDVTLHVHHATFTQAKRIVGAIVRQAIGKYIEVEVLP